MNSEGKVTLPAARETVTFPSSSGWRITSSARSFEFRQLIEEEDTIVGETHFARVWERTAAEQPNIADGVMRRAKWSRGDKRFFGIEQPGNAVNLCRLNRFLERKGRNDGGDTFGQHRFARTRWPDHQHVVTARHRDFNRAFDMSLALNISEIDVIALMRGKKSRQISTRWKQGSFTAQERERLAANFARRRCRSYRPSQLRARLPPARITRACRGAAPPMRPAKRL